MKKDWEPVPGRDWGIRHEVVSVPGDPYAPEKKIWNRPFLKRRWCQAAVLKVPASQLKRGYHIGYVTSQGEQIYYTKILKSPRVALPIGREPRQFFAFDPVVVTNGVPLNFRRLMTIRKVKHYRRTVLIRY